MADLAWWDWITLAPDHVIIDGRRLPIVAFDHARPVPVEGERTWGVVWIPAGESLVTVSMFCDYQRPESVFCCIVEYKPSPLGTRDWDLCWTGEADIHRYRRCQVGPYGLNYMAGDLVRAREVSDNLTSPESVFDLLAFASTIELVETDPEQKEHHGT